MTYLVNRFRLFIERLSAHQFYQGLAAIFAAIFLLSIIFGWAYYRTINQLTAEIEHINEQRVVAKKILERAQRVYYQRKEVDELLAQDPNFKIKGDFEELLSKLGLADKKKEDTKAESSGTEDGYSSDILRAHLEGITMKELTTLLQELEKNARLYLKELDIIKSKQPYSLDAIITIATLQPVSKQGEAGAGS